MVARGIGVGSGSAVPRLRRDVAQDKGDGQRRPGVERLAQQLRVVLDRVVDRADAGGLR